MRNRSRLLAVVAIVLSTIGCDRVSKHYASRELMGSPRRSYLADTLRVEYVENSGGFLSIGAGLPERVRKWIFVVGTSAALVGLSFGFVRRGRVTWSTVGLSLIWAGGLSNLLDRLVRGRVTDFLNVGIGPLRTGIFNVADLAITCGLALVLLAGRAREGEQRGTC
jgi:signal peptidase II